MTGFRWIGGWGTGAEAFGDSMIGYSGDDLGLLAGSVLGAFLSSNIIEQLTASMGADFGRRLFVILGACLGPVGI